MRANDAASAAPKIGSNIEGAGPDTLAATLAGEAGMKILDASAKHYSSSKELVSSQLVERSMTFDGKWMAALDDGCKQFVILAAGLDARAWRLPRMDKSVKVFEVDVPLAHKYKAEKLATLDAPLACTRVAVEADLSESGWVETLQKAGFDPTQRSFFLVEGLLMYLPPGAPEALLRATAGLMSAGSTLTGDSFVDSLRLTDQTFINSLGTKWTFDFSSHDAIKALLTSAGLPGATVEGIGAGAQAGGPQQPSDAGYAEAKARKMQQVLLALRAWPPAARDLTLPSLLGNGEAGVLRLVTRVVEDKLNFHGLADVDAATKATIVELVLSTPLPSPTHGSTHFGTALQAEAEELAGDPKLQRPRLQRWWSMGAFMINMMRREKQHGSTYVIYTATKA